MQTVIDHSTGAAGMVFYPLRDATFIIIFIHFFFCLWLCIIHLFFLFVSYTPQTKISFFYFTFDPRWLVLIMYQLSTKNHHVVPVGIKGLTRHPNKELNQLVPTLTFSFWSRCNRFLVDLMCAEVTKLLTRPFIDLWGNKPRKVNQI